jgi:hypothetical protein
VSKLVSLSKDDHEHEWFGTAGVFEWVAEFVRARVDDPALSEELRRDALSGYLFLGDLPGRTRDEVLRALRDDLIPAMEAEADRTPVFEEKVRELAGLASR